MSGEAVRQAAETVPDKHSLWSYITGGVTALWGALTLQEWAALIGVFALHTNNDDTKRLV